MDEEKARGYIYDKSHAMFTECPELWNHAGVIRKYLRLAYLDGAAQQKFALDEAICSCKLQSSVIGDNHAKDCALYYPPRQ